TGCAHATATGTAAAGASPGRACIAAAGAAAATGAAAGEEDRAPGTLGPRYFRVSVFLLSSFVPVLCFFFFSDGFSACDQGFPPQRFFYNRWHISRCPGGGDL